MLQISPAAITLLKVTLDSEGAEDDIFRLFIDDDKFAIKMAAAEDGDVIYKQEGEAVLAAPTDLAETLGSKVIDVEETSDGPRLVVFNQ